MRENTTQSLLLRGSKAWNPTTRFLGHSDAYRLEKVEEIKHRRAC
jgi:hypothetical protein